MHFGLGLVEVFVVGDVGRGDSGGDGLMHMLGSGAGAAHRVLLAGDVVSGVHMSRLGRIVGVDHWSSSVSVFGSGCIEFVGEVVMGVVVVVWVVCNVAAINTGVVGVWVVGFVLVRMEGGCGICCCCDRLNRWRHCLYSLALSVGVCGGGACCVVVVEFVCVMCAFR